jgi:hypothetical protein
MMGGPLLLKEARPGGVEGKTGVTDGRHMAPKIDDGQQRYANGRTALEDIALALTGPLL